MLVGLTLGWWFEQNTMLILRVGIRFNSVIFKSLAFDLGFNVQSNPKQKKN